MGSSCFVENRFLINLVELCPLEHCVACGVVSSHALYYYIYDYRQEEAGCRNVSRDEHSV